ncbi:MAG: hypothetical protein HYZ50_08125 [Deltaproteobacteria bacterium]|nr:hypothetical protein [Deltaproteobacteria bacterium]
MDWGALVAETLHLYQQAAIDTWEKGRRSWWIGLLPFLYGPVVLLSAMLTAPLGFLGGFISGILLAMCVSSYLYFIAGVVNGSRMSVRELGESWRPYLSSVINILFFLFLLQYMLALLTPPGDETALLLSAFLELILLVILNPLPEIIYQGRSEGFGMVQESLDFLRGNGAEWFLPFIVLAIFSMLFLPISILAGPLQFGRLTFPTTMGGPTSGSALGFLWPILSAFLLFALMIFRGLLFRALANSTRRQRMFRSHLS